MAALRIPAVAAVVVWIASLATLPQASQAAVSAYLSDADATPTTTLVAPGKTFPVSVFLASNSSSDAISSINYHVQISAAGSGLFTLSARTSTSVFLPYLGDTDSRVVPVTLSPTNGSTNLGGERGNNADLNGSPTGSTFDVADLVLSVAANTPVGTYTLSFVPASTSYGGSTAGGAQTAGFASLGSFTVVVPEPASLAGVAAVASTLRRRRRVI